MSLLLDLGNTRLKWARQEQGGLTAQGAAAWDRIEDEGLPQACLELARAAGRVRAASVAGSAREQRLARALEAHDLPTPEWVRTPAAACGVRNAYPEPSRLGVDRFLGMVAAHAAGHAPCLVVSAGTALALDALAGGGRHLGGLIAPGPRLMQRSLHQAAAQLPETGDGELLDAAVDTASAIASGCWQAALGLIERFHARMRFQLGNAPVLVLCGGDAAALAAHLTLPLELRPDLVLEGLAVWDRDPPAA